MSEQIGSERLQMASYCRFCARDGTVNPVFQRENRRRVGIISICACGIFASHLLPGLGDLLA
ncbi:MAG TPA: hypothetical protein VHK04_11650 [Castellaniella sp.]|nr:hypothetical protein [Castellaniella sp.]